MLHNYCLISVVIMCQFWLHNVNIIIFYCCLNGTRSHRILTDVLWWVPTSRNDTKILLWGQLNTDLKLETSPWKVSISNSLDLSLLSLHCDFSNIMTWYQKNPKCSWFCCWTLIKWHFDSTETFPYFFKHVNKVNPWDQDSNTTS